jgi:radical SAM protein with 4Fe4S-binding SPASM domain
MTQESYTGKRVAERGFILDQNSHIIIYLPFLGVIQTNRAFVDLFADGSAQPAISAINASPIDPFTCSVLSAINHLPRLTYRWLSGFRDYGLRYGYGVRATPTLVVIPTERCNLGCHYCYSNATGKGHDLRWDDVLPVLEALHPSWQDAPAKVVFNGGGEPTLNFSLIQRTTEYLKKHASSHMVGLTTNGMFPTKRVNWLSQNNFSVSISIDGTPDVEALHGRASASPTMRREDRLKANTEALNEEGVHVSALATVTQQSVEQMLATASYVHSLGIKSISFCPVNCSGRAQRTSFSSPSPASFVSGFLQAYDFGVEVGLEVQATDCLATFDKLIFMHCKGESGTVLTVAPGGRVFTCMEAASRGHPYAHMFSLPIDRIQCPLHEWNPHLQDLRNPLRIPQCRECFVLPQCGGGCLMRNLEKDSTSVRSSVSPYCDIVKGIARHMLLSVVKRGRANPHPPATTTPEVPFVSRFAHFERAERSLQLMLKLAQHDMQHLTPVSVVETDTTPQT